LAADRAPRTSPRRASNQRVATIAASTIEVTPVPAPTQTPHSSINCHVDAILVVSATDTASSDSASSTMRRRPQRSIADAANGPINPKSAILIATAAEMTVRLHPNSLSSDTISTPGVARTAAVTSSTTKVAAATIHA
jgi:hypothetical protein